MCDTDSKKHMLDLMTFCKKIEPFVLYYKRLIKSYKIMACNFLENEINLILPQIQRKQKDGIITMLVSSFIGLAYESNTVSYITNEIRLYTKLSELWIVKLLSSTTN